MKDDFPPKKEQKDDIRNLINDFTDEYYPFENDRKHYAGAAVYDSKITLKYQLAKALQCKMLGTWLIREGNSDKSLFFCPIAGRIIHEGEDFFLGINSFMNMDSYLNSLDEMPSGRLPIKNLAISSTERRRIYRFMYGQIKQGRQAYVICPEVEEGVMSDLENVQDYTEKLRKIFPPEVRIDSLNGRMKPAEKTEIMERFSAGQTDILVSTTVIEVGIDVPNASVIAIENAERFGMSQLHQLRGRVGRGKWQSYCIFLYTEGAEGEGSGAGKPKRLEILEKTNDGFVIAEEDLKLRGPGDLFGERQSGELGFVLADIYEDSAIMRKAAAYVDEVLASDPDFKMPHLRQLDFRTI